MKATDFHLKDQNGKERTLSEFKGKWVVLYFYPKDDTPGCTKEACGFRDSFRELQKMNVQILGISKDSVSSHKKFADKYNLNFPLLSDEDVEIIKAYKSWGIKKFMGRIFQGIIRNTYLIDPKGEIAKFYEKINPLTHASQIISDLKILSIGT